MSNEVIDLKEGEVQEASQEMSFESQQEVQEDAAQEVEQETSEQEPVEQSPVEQSPVNQVISKQEENDSKKEAEELSNLLDSFADASDDQKNALLEDAIARARKILQTNPSNDAANYFVAQDELKKRNYELAMQALQRAIEFNKRNYLYYYDLGKVYYLRKDYKAAAEGFLESIELNDHYHPSWYNLGLTQLKIQSPEEALKSFLTSVQVNPDYEKGWLETARTYKRLNDLENAISAYKNVIQINNRNLQPVMELGSIYFDLCRFVEAEDMYKEALQHLSKGEEQTLTKYNLSVVLIEDKKYEEALVFAWEAYDEKDFLKKDEIRFNVVYNYALVNELLGNTDKAIALYKESLDANPGHRKSKINLANLLMNYPDAENEAVALLEEVFSENPSDSTIEKNLANAYFLAALYEKSLLHYQALLENNKEEWDAYLKVAKCYIQLGDSENALRYLAYLNSMNPAFNAEEVELLLNTLL